MKALFDQAGQLIMLGGLVVIALGAAICVFGLFVMSIQCFLTD
jgi:hypothetical protein